METLYIIFRLEFADKVTERKFREPKRSRLKQSFRSIEKAKTAIQEHGMVAQKYVIKTVYQK